MTAFFIVIGSIVLGWFFFEQFSPWGSVAKMKEMERNE